MKVGPVISVCVFQFSFFLFFLKQSYVVHSAFNLTLDVGYTHLCSIWDRTQSLMPARLVLYPLKQPMVLFLTAGNTKCNQNSLLAENLLALAQGLVVEVEREWKGLAA